jgi:hypothetical protein
MNNPLKYEIYSVDRLAVRTTKQVCTNSDRKKFSKVLRSVGGRWNSKLKGAPGWMVPRDKEEELKELIGIPDNIDNEIVKIKDHSKPIRGQDKYHRAVSYSKKGSKDGDNHGDSDDGETTSVRKSSEKTEKLIPARSTESAVVEMRKTTERRKFEQEKKKYEEKHKKDSPKPVAKPKDVVSEVSEVSKPVVKPKDVVSEVSEVSDASDVVSDSSEVAEEPSESSKSSSSDDVPIPCSHDYGAIYNKVRRIQQDLISALPKKRFKDHTL